MENVSELSIVIPTYNQECARLVEELYEQARQVEGLRYEIIVAEDGSTSRDTIEANSRISHLPCCRQIVRRENVGRAAIRNFLVSEARHPWLLFIDSRMQIADDMFLAHYLSHATADLVYGGYTVREDPSLRHNLRYLYERHYQKRHPASERQSHPYMDFHTSNFMVRKRLLADCPFDERFQHYGYEDVLYGKQLERRGVSILHIYNPVMFDKFESNERFMAKTDEALHTLYLYKEELGSHSRMIQLSDRLKRWHLIGAVRLAYRCFGKHWRKNCTGVKPSVRVFNLYRLGKFVEKRD